MKQFQLKAIHKMKRVQLKLKAAYKAWCHKVSVSRISIHTFRGLDQWSPFLFKGSTLSILFSINCLFLAIHNNTLTKVFTVKYLSKTIGLKEQKQILLSLIKQLNSQCEIDVESLKCTGTVRHANPKFYVIALQRWCFLEDGRWCANKQPHK